MTGGRWVSFAVAVGLGLIATAVYTLHIDFPSIERDWHELLALVLGGGCLTWAFMTIIESRERE